MNLDNFVVKSVSFSFRSSCLAFLLANFSGNKNIGIEANKSENPMIRNPNHHAPIHLGSFDFMSGESVYNF